VKLQRATINNVPALPDLSDPLIVRCAQTEDTEELNELLGRAYPDEDWQLECTESELFHDKTLKVVWIVVVESKLLATASLQTRSDAHDVGWVRWVATS